MLLLLTSQFVKAQNEGWLEDMYMQGKWNASCATEVVDHATIRNCELCLFVLNPADKSQGSPHDIDLTFNPDSLILDQNGRKTTVRWQRNKDDHSFWFNLAGKKYAFRVFLYGSDKRILEDSEGLLLVLEKAK